MQIATILLPLDLEWLSRRAVHQAALLARHFHSRIVIVSAVREASFLGIDLESTETLMQSARREWETIDQTIALDLAGIPVEKRLLPGDPARVILETAVHEKADLIVMGPHGREGTAKLMGSVTHNILNAAETPIWSYGDWDRRLPALEIRKLVCGVDFTAHDHKVIEWAAAAAVEFKSQVVLAHATPAVEIYGPGGYYSPAELTKSLTESATEHVRKLMASSRVDAEVFVRSGDVDQVLNDAARETGATLLVIGRRPSMGMLGGHAYKIVSRAHVPVLSV